MNEVTTTQPVLRLSDLWESALVAGLQLQSRFAMAPMTRRFSPEGIPGQDVADYYARRAANGVGLIITEGILLDHEAAGASAGVPRFGLPQTVPAWRRVTDAVHAAGGKIVAQLWHLGVENKKVKPQVGPREVLSPSGLDLDGQPRGGAMTTGDIQNVIESYARAAQEAMAAGFDGVEIHAAHGYLLDEFLWSITNRRDDEYGGDLNGRARLLAEVTSAVRRVIGPQTWLAVRLSQWKTGHYEAKIVQNPQQWADLLQIVTDAGGNVIHPSTRRIAEPAFADSTLTLGGWAKKLSSAAVIAVGSVGLAQQFQPGVADATSALSEHQGVIAQLEAVLDPPQGDLIAVGRSLLANPHWVQAIRDGEIDTLRPYDKAQERDLI